MSINSGDSWGNASQSDHLTYDDTNPNPAPLYLRTLWRYTNAVIIIITVTLTFDLLI